MIDKAVIDHLPGNIEDHHQSYIGDPTIALDISRDNIGGDAHQSDRKQQSYDEYAWMCSRRACNPQYIIEAHGNVSQSDCPGGSGKALGGTNPAMLIPRNRSEEHTSELQSLMRISYAVFCLNKNNKTQQNTTTTTNN